jgi:hypothetical protein
MGVSSSVGRVGVGLGLAFAVAACGGGAGGSGSRAGDVEAGFGAGEPGVPAGDVVVGDDQAWVVGRQGDRYSAVELWRLDPDTAAPEHLGTATALQGASQEATGDGLELAGWRCDGGDMPDCDTSVAELVRLDDAGEETDRVTLTEKPGPLDPSDGVAIVGRTSGSTWVAVQGSLVEVSAGGDVVSTVETSLGEHCVIGDRLYALVEPDSPESPDAVGSSGSSSSFEVRENADGWQAVARGGPEALDNAEPLSGFCGDGQFEVTTPGGTLVAVWRPGGGWSRVRAAAGRPAAGAIEAGSPVGDFAKLRDGRVVERTRSGGYTPTGLDLEPPAAFDPAAGPVAVSADSSDTLVAACVTWPATTDTATTTCDVARR